ncbi:MAG: hypothetical protein AB7F50_11220 [Fimbriimonadaceae bacterium]
MDVYFSAKAETYPYSGTQPFDDADVVKIRAKIGNSKTHTWNFSPGGDPPSGGVTFDFEQGHGRFASTNFEDGNTVVLWMEATFRLYQNGGSMDVTLPVSANFKAYNQQLTFGTTVGTQPNPFLPSMEEVSTEFSQRARTKLNDVKHASLSGADLQERPGLDVHLGSLAAKAVATHGAPGGFCDSHMDDYNDPVHGYDWAEAGFNVGLSTRTANGVPLPNLIPMYSCDCFGAAAAATFGIDEDSVDKAFLGFDQKVHAFLILDDVRAEVSLWDVIFDGEGNIDIKGYLHQHMEKLLDIARGSGSIHTSDLKRFGDAVSTANAKYMPRGLDASTGMCPAVPARYLGDPSTTSNRVYLNNSEWFSVPQGTVVTWYYFFP